MMVTAPLTYQSSTSLPDHRTKMNTIHHLHTQIIILINVPKWNVCEVKELYMKHDSGTQPDLNNSWHKSVPTRHSYCRSNTTCCLQVTEKHYPTAAIGSLGMYLISEFRFSENCPENFPMCQIPLRWHIHEVKTDAWNITTVHNLTLPPSPPLFYPFW